MRKSLLIIVAVMVVAISAPNAHADTFTYSYTTPGGIFWTTAAISAVTMQTIVPAADLTAILNTGLVAGCGTKEVVLDGAGAGATETVFSGCMDLADVTNDGFTPSDYTTPGTYVSPLFPSLDDTLVVTAAVAAPEPSSVALMLLGVGLVFVMRKRIGQGLPQAS